MPSGNIGYGGGKSTTSDIENVEWNIGTAQLPHVVRYGSGSSQTSQSSGDICRICHCESDLHNPLLTPCYCSGSLKYVHQTCLQQWLTASETNSCELCKFPFIMHTKIKPFNEWESLEMSGVERRRLCCAVLFHCAAAICVIWSLCVLIERAAEEVKRGQIGWPFWTKLVVVTVGLTGGMVFMYIQCRQYLHLCHRWRARNRILLIQNAPEKMHPLSPPSPVLVSRHHLPRSSSGSHPTHGATMHGPGGLGMGCSSGGAGSGAGSSGGCSGSGMSAGPHHHHHHAMATTSGQHGANNRPSHGQIVANIENNPLHYERDWQLDDSSQSSFRPCPQGSGSMTPMPFHDSVHNMYETASTSTTTAASTTAAQGGVPGASSMPPRRSSSNNSTSNGSLNYDPLTQSIAVQRGGQKQQPQQQQQQTTASEVGQFKGAAPPNSAVFLENSDILNDAQYPKLYHRHSAAFVDAHMPHTAIAVGSAAADHHPSLAYVTSATPNAADTRRYSDTRLLQQQDPIFNVTSVLGVAIPRAIVSDMDEPNANVTEILFGDAATAPSTAGAYDPLELNIQEMLELDGHRRGGREAHGRKGRHSLHNVSTTLDGAAAAADAAAAAAGATAGSLGVMANRMGVFKSLPNLSASSENLLQK